MTYLIEARSPRLVMKEGVRGTGQRSLPEKRCRLTMYQPVLMVRVY